MVNIVIVLLDGLRFDHSLELPTFRELVKSGWFFDRMYAPSTFTNAIINSLQSGMYPPRHGHRIWDPGSDALPDTVFVRKDIKTLDDYLREAGYAMVGNMTASMRRPPVKLGQDTIPKLFEYAAGHQPFCMFLHCWQIHDTCVTNQTLRNGLTEELYRYGLIGAEGFLGTAMSEDIGNTLWIIFGDHGLAVGDERKKSGPGDFGAGHVYDFRVRIPCVILGPGIRMDYKHSPCSLIDILPTILDYLGIDEDSSPDQLAIRGCSMFPSPMGKHAVYFEAQSPYGRWASYQPNVFGATDGRLKVMVTPDGNQCYDLVEDPRENHPCKELLKTRRAKDLLAFIEEIRGGAGD